MSSQTMKPYELMVKLSTSVDGEPRVKLPDISDITKLDQKNVFEREMKGEGHLHPKEAQGIMTDVVTEYFNFMACICFTFKDAINYYCERMGLKKSTSGELGDIIFIYKGGNVMRILFNEFSKNLSLSSTRLCREYFSNYFKKSDSDFSILINPELQNFKQIYDDMIRLSYLIQVILRDKIFNKEPKGDTNDVFTYLEYNDEKKEIILKNILNELQNMKSIDDPLNDLFYQAQIKGVQLYDSHYSREAGYQKKDDCSSKTDLILDVIDKIGSDGNSYLRTYPISDKKYPFPISANLGLDFIKGTSDKSTRIKFALVRTKINLKVSFIKDGIEDFKNIGGELIDCTIIDKLSSSMDSGEKYEQAKQKITDYKLEDSTGKNKVEFFSYNLKGLIYDLERILFVDSEKAWDDQKYKKRINRVFFLYMIDLFNKIDSIEKRLELVEEFRKEIVNKVKILIETNKLSEINSSLSINFDSDYAITKIITYIAETASRINGLDDMNKFMEMMDTIDLNTGYMKDIIRDVMIHLKQEALFETDDNQISVNSLN
jgi:hypothetical protein